MKDDCKRDPFDYKEPEKCCTAETGCHFDGSLRNVVAEPIYTQKVYDATLFNLHALKTIQNQPFSPSLDPNSRIIRILDIRCKKFFNANDIDDPRNLKVTPETEISGAQFVKRDDEDIEVIGPDGKFSEKLLYTDTSDCDEKCKGTPIFGTQNLSLTGNVLIEIDAIVQDDCNKKCKVTLTANVEIAPIETPLILTNFFELCMPSVFDSAYFPRFTEFCNISCCPRLATNNINRDIKINSKNGKVRANLLITIGITCEKKIVVPVQLCVLSTGFPKLKPSTSPITGTFPSLFPKQIDEESQKKCRREKCEKDIILNENEIHEEEK
ncbi:hypothetical protein [Garciella nitratireducens]|uniref:hypothetical protein n=1 Tax=Garciella nitratireducens TaxID=218205 RepID=UPI000DFFF1E8|nr:hypothetical protein [Garciella nitratireducens]RBP41543.1 hypothetical protein DFR81_11013 [Garciella nitratireducens]